MINSELLGAGVWRIVLGEPESITPVSRREVDPDFAALSRLGSVEMPEAMSSIAFESTQRGCTIRISLQANDRIYGLGLQLKSFEHTASKKALRVNSDPIGDTGDSHAPVPFYVSSQGYGVLVDTARYANFYCGSHAATGENTTAETDAFASADNAEELYRRRKIPRGPMVIDIPTAQGVTLYLFGGPTLRNAVQRYILFSGGGCLPPMWGLGIWYRGHANHSQDRAIALAGTLRERTMPCDVYGLESGWHSHAYACSFRFHPTRFPDPQKFMTEMTRLGFRVNLWEHVFVDPSAEIYAQLLPLSGDLQVWSGIVPDLMHPTAREIFGNHQATEFVEKGISGFKLDECDNSDFIVYPWSFPEFSKFPSGADGEQMHSLLGITFQRMIQSLYRRAGRRTYSQVRSSHALASPYPFVLYSDLYSHRDFIRGLLSAGFSGLLWCPEVREASSAEDLIRRIQTVVFSPQALVNAWYLENPPWTQVDQDANRRGEFMPDWLDTESHVKEAFRWRMRLIPYLYAAFARYREEGIPPFRALAMDWPDDANACAVSDQYMMGDDLLVAPLIAGEFDRLVYLPEGQWFHLFSHTTFSGGQTHRVSSGLNEIPVFVRSGAILPLADPVEFVTPDTVFNLEVQTFGTPCRPIALHEDDGETFDFEKGSFNKIALMFDREAGPSVERSGSYPFHRYQIRRWLHY